MCLGFGRRRRLRLGAEKSPLLQTLLDMNPLKKTLKLELFCAKWHRRLSMYAPELNLEMNAAIPRGTK